MVRTDFKNMVQKGPEMLLHTYIDILQMLYSIYGSNFQETSKEH